MRRALLFAVASFVCVAGCGERPAPVHPVRGKVTVNGEPAAGATVAFHPILPPGKVAPVSVASTRPDGTFSLTTFDADDGAPAGEYTVTIWWQDPTKPYDECGDQAAHDKLQGRYADKTQTRLRATIVPGLNEINFNPVTSWSFQRLRDKDAAPGKPNDKRR